MATQRQATQTPGLSPLTFPEEEVDALLLGLTMVAAEEESGLAEPAAAARARILAALPPEPPYRPQRGDPPLRRAILGALAAEHGLRLRYRDGKGAATERVVWPILLEGDDEDGVLAAWCTLREDFRHFRLDRMAVAETTGARYPTRRRLLLAEWQHHQIVHEGW